MSRRNGDRGPRRLAPSRAALVLRGALAAVVLLGASVALVAYGGGSFDSDPEVSAVIPAAAGDVGGGAAVQYQGVAVGAVVGIDAGTTQSNVVLRIDRAQLDRIPAAVVVRIVPRTLFGDVYLRLIPRYADPSIGPRLSAGEELAADTSADAVQLYQLYRQASDLLERMQPAKLQVALTAISQALRGQGQALGDTIDRMSAVTGELEPKFDAVLASSPQLRQVSDALRSASGDLIDTLRSATALSQLALDHQGRLDGLLTAGVTLANSVGEVASAQQQRIITVVRAGAPVLGTLAANRAGLADTLDQLGPFGEKGARVFATGRFNITAVPDFSDPLPYTAADCPRYPGAAGANCDAASARVAGVSDVVDARRERPALAELQGVATSRQTADPNVATSLMLGPLVRGTQVRVP